MSALTAGPRLLPLTEDQERQFGAWRVEALDAMPYFASVLLSLRPVNAPGLGTFAVDPRYRLYIDFEAVADWSSKLCGQALLHECCHLFYDHAARAKDMAVEPHESRLSNIASDAEANDDLRDAGCAELVEMGMLPSKLGLEDYQTFEHYLHELRQRSQAAQRKRQQQGGAGQKPPQPGQGSGTGPGQQPGQSPGQDEGGQGQPSQAPGQPGGQGQQPSRAGGSDQAAGSPYAGCGSGSGGPSWDGELAADDDLGGAAPGASTIEQERIRITASAQISDYAAKHQGNVPVGLVSVAQQVLAPPKVPWRQTLRSLIKRGVASKTGDYDVTFTRRHRRMPYFQLAGGRVLRPGIYSPEPTMAVVEDTSGSMSDDDLQRCRNEIDGIAKQIGIRGKALRVYDVDAEVHAVRDYRGAESIAERHGRGGTDMCVGIEAALAERQKPTIVVVCTDGYTGWPDKRTPVPLVICLIPQKGQTSVPDHLIESCPQWAKVVVAVD